MIVKIGAYDFVVTDMDEKTRYDRSVLGLCYCNEHRIEIWKEQPPRAWAASLLHEILHAIWFVYNQDYEPEDEERIVRVFEHGMMQVFSDNPHLRDILFPKEKQNAGTGQRQKANPARNGGTRRQPKDDSNKRSK